MVIEIIETFAEKCVFVNSDNLSGVRNMVGCPVCRSKNAQDLPIQIIDLTL